MNRGKALEKRINRVNMESRKKGESLILQIPTPIVLTRMGLVAKESTVDFAGILPEGKFIAFDTKETNSATSFPIKNIKQHQFIYLDMVDKLGGIAFFMIHFVKLFPDKAFITPMSYIRTIYKGLKKSIPIKSFDKNWLVDIDTYLDKIIKKSYE